MGVILQGILGGFSGKVGPVVGGKWKDVDYMRSYVIPSNPNTIAQQAVRTKFAQLVAHGRSLLSTLLQPYWDPFYSDMSGFNAFIKENYALADVDGKLAADAIMTKGTLTGALINDAVYTTGTGAIQCSWDSTLVGNALATDNIVAVALDITNQYLEVFNPTETRTDETFTVTFRTGLTATNIAFFLAFYRGTGSELIVSDSAGELCSAP